MFALSGYQIAILTILFLTMCAQFTIAFVVSSKYYAVKYVSAEERESLAMQEKVRQFIGEMVFADNPESRAKFAEFIKQEKEKKE